MPSSTTNSDRSVSPSARLATWISAAVLAGLVLAAYEVILRAHGLRPSVTDDRELWASARERAVGADDHVLVLCGASRIQLGFSIAAARAELPGFEIVQLAIDGTHAVASFRDLAEDPSFRGVALFSMLPVALRPEVWEDQTPWVRRRRAGWTVNDDLNRRWRSVLQEHLTIMAPEAEITRLARRLLYGQPLARQPMLMRADRSRLADYSEVPAESYAAARLQRDWASLVGRPEGAAYDRWLDAVDRFDALVRSILARGGKVVLFHDLLSGEYRRVYEEAYPRDHYWNVLVARSSAVCIHAQDVADLAALFCPDGSHLDAKDAPRFTRALLTELRRHGVLPYSVATR